MKLRGSIAALLGLNFVLIGALCWLAARKPAASAPETVTQTVIQTVRNDPISAAPEESDSPSTPTISRFDWRQVESPDYKEYIANLRRIGCPEQTIRDIIIADVSKLYAEKRAALFNAPKIVRYWQSSEMQYTRDNVKYQASVRELEKEKEQLIRDLLGVELKREVARVYGGDPSYDRSLMFLPEERRGTIQDVLDHYRDLERAVYAGANGELNEEQQARVKSLREERERAIASLMSPSEQKEYEMTNSRLAREIRNSLNGFEATEQEFLAVYEARKLYEETFGDGRERKKETPEQQAARKLAEQQMESAIASAMGDTRYADFKRSQNDGWEDLYRVIKRYDLPKESAVAVYAVRQAAEAEYRNIQGNASIPPDQRAAALQQLSAQAKQAAANALGSDAFNYYFRKNGQWLNRIGQMPQPPKKSG